jgi:hypothetical protein
MGASNPAAIRTHQGPADRAETGAGTALLSAVPATRLLSPGRGARARLAAVLVLLFVGAVCCLGLTAAGDSAASPAPSFGFLAGRAVDQAAARLATVARQLGPAR